MWSKTYDKSDYESISVAQQTNDGGYILLGSTRVSGISDYRMWVIKTDSSGVKEWDALFNYGQGYRTYPSWINQTSDGGYVALGYFRSDATWYDIWFFRLNSRGVCAACP